MQHASITARKTCGAQKHQDVGEKTMKEEIMKRFQNSITFFLKKSLVHRRVGFVPPRVGLAWCFGSLKPHPIVIHWTRDTAA